MGFRRMRHRRRWERGCGRRAGDLRGCAPDLGNVEWGLVANVVQLQSYNFICLLRPPASCRRFAFPQPFSATDRYLPSSCPVRADCEQLQAQMTRHFPKSIQAPCHVASTIESRHVCGAD